MTTNDIKNYINVGLVGHVANGKTTLVEALTGVSTKRDSKEIKSGRTIKLGYANCLVWKCDKCQKVNTTGQDKKKYGCCGKRLVPEYHISFLDCFGKGTQIQMADSSIKNIEEIEEGDCVMGPQGDSRKVEKCITGHKKLYNISYKKQIKKSLEPNGFVCTGGHILILRVDTPLIPPGRCGDRFRVGKIVYKNHHLCTEDRYFASKDDADEYYNSLDNMPQIFEMTVEEYLSSPKTVRSRARLFIGPEREFSPIIDLSIGKASSEEVAWLIGLWLADGSTSNPVLTVGTKDDLLMTRITEISTKMGLTPVINPYKNKKALYVLLSTLTGCKRYGKISNNNDDNMFANILQKLGIFDRKFIPKELRLQSVSTRKALLAGFVDGDGYYRGGEMSICQSMEHKELSYGILWIVRSLGMTGRICEKRATYFWNGEKRGKTQYRVSFNGQLKQLPIVLPHKQGKNCTRHWHTSVPFEIKELPEGDYYGFKIANDDGQFLLADGVVAHNCPGHHSYVGNMIKGSAVVDCAILVVDVRAPTLQTQTLEHLAILDILGVKNIIVVQNKVDLVGAEQCKKHYNMLKVELLRTSAENAPIIPASAQTGFRLDKIQQYLREMVRNVSQSLKTSDKNVFSVIRSFDINRPGTEIDNLKGGVLGGTTIGAGYAVGDIVEIHPGLIKKDGSFQVLKTKIGSIFAEKKSLKNMVRGGLYGVGTGLDPTLTKDDGLVGCLVGSKEDLPEIKTDLEMTVISLREGFDGGKVPKIKAGKAYRLIIGSNVVNAMCEARSKKWAHMKLLKPICTLERKCLIYSCESSNTQLIGFGIFGQQEKEEHIVNVHQTQEEYTSLLPEQETKEKVRIAIPVPIMMRENRNVIWSNMGMFCQVVHRQETHVSHYLQRELCISTSICQNGLRIYKTRINAGKLQKVLRKYIVNNISCDQCKGITELSTCGKLQKATCLTCGSARIIN